jgi:hypothetical protein
MMRALASIVIGVLGLWLSAPTYDQMYRPWSFAGDIVALIVFPSLIIGGLIVLALKLNEACK